MEALKPNLYDDIRAVWSAKEIEEVESQGIDLEDQIYATLSNSRGWKHLKKHIESLKDGLDKRLAESVLKSLGADQIKNDALFSVLGKELLNSIINKVEDSALVVDEIKSKNGRSKK